MKVGMIGLGIMGKPMARNLLRSGGIELYICNRSHAPVEELAKEGAHESDYVTIGSGCEVVLTMLPNSPQVKDVMLGEGGAGNTTKLANQIIVACNIQALSKR